MEEERKQRRDGSRSCYRDHVRGGRREGAGRSSSLSPAHHRFGLSFQASRQDCTSLPFGVKWGHVTGFGQQNVSRRDWVETQEPVREFPHFFLAQEPTTSKTVAVPTTRVPGCGQHGPQPPSLERRHEREVNVLFQTTEMRELLAHTD